MIISRIFPHGTERYSKTSKLIARFDDFFLPRWNLFFALWSMLLAGFGTAVIQDERYLYWHTGVSLNSILMFVGFTLVFVALFTLSSLRGNVSSEGKMDCTRKLSWVSAVLGIISLLIAKITLLIPVTFLVVLLGPLTGYKPFDYEKRGAAQAALYFATGFGLFLTGWVYKGGNPIDGLWLGLPYALAFTAVSLVYQIPMEISSDKIPVKLTDFRLRTVNLWIALALTVAATYLGYYNGDPVISTAACVYIPFLVVALVFPPHFRHILRCRVYPVFIIAMLVAVRHPWFLLPLGINWWVLRSYTYLRFGLPQPTFRVDYD